jgi:hypothetical protein
MGELWNDISEGDAKYIWSHQRSQIDDEYVCSSLISFGLYFMAVAHEMNEE